MKKTRKMKKKTSGTKPDRPAARPCAAANTPPEGAVSPDLLAQLANTLWLPHDMGAAERAARLDAARAMLEDIAPDDGIAGMLACQMVATHEAAMACLGRSMTPDQTN